MKIFSTAQVKAWDAYTIEHEPVTSVALMERAAMACCEWLLGKWEASDRSFFIFCGKGNNGGDGLALARLLLQAGRKVTVYILEPGYLGTDDFQYNLQQIHLYNIPVHFIQHEHHFPVIAPNTIVIDALLGAGLNRPLKDLWAKLVQHINAAHATVVSIDMPTGLPVDVPVEGEFVIQATYTLTFESYKLALLLPENARWIGEVVVLPIGLHNDFAQEELVQFEVIDNALIQSLYHSRSRFVHKANMGHALLLVGSLGKMGAAMLAAKACLRSGTGLLSCWLPEPTPVLTVGVPEAMSVSCIEEAALLRITACGAGPGIGTSTEAIERLTQLLTHFKIPAVLDADALNILAQHEAKWQLVTPGSVLTPHPREFERLFGPSQNDYERIKTALQKAAEHQCIIVLKGHHTFIACPHGKGYFNHTGNAGMATGGSGDVLTGIITALLAQGYDSVNAALIGVYLHGRAGDIALNIQSEESLIASDITENLGAAFRELK